MEALPTQDPMEGQRLLLMDCTRGLALFGIFLVNLTIMAGPSMAFGDDALWTGSVSRTVQFLRHFFADGAFIFLFSMLFGMGFTVMLQRLSNLAARHSDWSIFASCECAFEPRTRCPYCRASRRQEEWL